MVGTGEEDASHEETGVEVGADEDQNEDAVVADSQDIDGPELYDFDIEQ